ncbi:hypothetical protein FMJ40_25455 [Klebsiella variicola]|nr:hypothetical protein [Klebsiella variicola]MBZ6577935.1 hypothetical protein [Klebsiella variicola]MBZ7586869.1 hypothetical protein [Klebsiella variicola]HBX5736161.1 hypothetical protein [Klebsiella pneumoniae]
MKIRLAPEAFARLLAGYYVLSYLQACIPHHNSRLPCVKVALNVIAGVTFDGRFLLSTYNCKGVFHMAPTDVFTKRLPSDFQGAWFLLNTSSEPLLKIL